MRNIENFLKVYFYSIILQNIYYMIKIYNNFNVDVKIIKTVKTSLWPKNYPGNENLTSLSGYHTSGKPHYNY